MKKACFYTNSCLLLFTLIFFTTCNGQGKPSKENPRTKPPQSVSDPDPQSVPDHNPQIAEYIRNIFQDKTGNLWFGTNGYGVANYDGDSVSYFSIAQSFDGQQITGIAEDQEKNIWFATDQGVVKFDWSEDNDGGKRFTNYTDKRYFGGQRFWSICADSKNNIWAGSATGVFRFDSISWAPFELPYPEEVKGKFITKGNYLVYFRRQSWQYVV